MEEQGWEEIHDYPSLGEVPMGKAERCKPDYEKIISGLKVRHCAASELYAAIKRFIRDGYGINKNRLKDLLGHLDCQIDGLAKDIERVVAEQEKDQ